MGANNLLEIQQLFGGLSPSEPDFKWYVVHTKPRWEKKFAHYCYLYKINYFLPLQDSVKTYGNRKVTFTVPIFPGYVFLKCKLSDKSTLLRSGCVVRFLSVPDEQELLDDLINIYETLNRHLPVTQHIYVKEGYKVRITDGPFVDVEGVVIDADNPSEVIVGIHFIQQAVCVQVSPSQIELISRTSDPEF